MLQIFSLILYSIFFWCFSGHDAKLEFLVMNAYVHMHMHAHMHAKMLVLVEHRSFSTLEGEVSAASFFQSFICVLFPNGLFVL